VLDAIHYLSFTKSVLNNSDAQNVLYGEDYFVIAGEFDRESKSHSIRCQFDGKKKKVLEDDQECARFSDHIGRYPVVMIAPQDITLIWEAGEGRRRFFDQWVSQLNKPYLEHLVGYNYQLKQRNSVLREAQSVGRIDVDLMESYNEKLSEHAQVVYSKRKSFVSKLNPELQKVYAWLCHSEETVEVVYRSQLDQASIMKLLSENLEREMAAGRTLSGIHLDEFQFTLNGHEVRKTGSQGQQKSFLISLKMVELTQLTEKLSFSPIVLLDDIFDKMDNDRISRFMELLYKGEVGQFLLTDANPERVQKIFNIANLDFLPITIEKGMVR
jgi:DNA replication and repair protein RecF